MAKRTKSYGLNNPLQDVFPVPVKAERAPTAKDTRYEIGQVWVNQSASEIYGLSSVNVGEATWTLLGVGTSDLETLTGDAGGPVSPAAGNINILGGDGLTVNGSGSTLTINRDAAGGFPITPFVVGTSGEAGYQTVQAALDAANSAGGGLVFVQPGTYTENLIFYDKVDVVGGAFSGPTITGVHIPPSSGNITIRNCTLTSPTSLFNSAAAGTTDITVETCILSVTNGYVYNLLNWTGNLLIDDCGSSSVNDGVINNTGGASVKLTDTTVGAGTGNTFTYAGGSLVMEGVVLQCPSTLGTGSTSTIRLGSVLTATLTTTNDAIVSISNTTLSTGATAAISHGSTGTFSLSTCTVNSSNNPAIAGAGAGILSLTGADFLNDSILAGTLTIGGGNTKAGTFETSDTASGLQISSNSIISEGSDANISIDITPKGTGEVKIEKNSAGQEVLLKVSNTSGVASSNSAVEVSSFDDSVIRPSVRWVKDGGSTFSAEIVDDGGTDMFSLGEGSPLIGNGSISITEGTGDVSVNTSLTLPTTATQLQMKGGSATDFIGQATLVAGTVTVANTNISSVDKIFLTREGIGASAKLGGLNISITPSTSFTITSLEPGSPGTTEITDLSIINYFIVRQI